MLSQIKPHFLYNTLTTIGELCDLEPKVAKGAMIAENAVRHGTMRREEGGTVTIRSEETKTAYVITVTDDGIGFDENVPIVDDDETHVGIANVKSRLQMMTNGTLSIKSVKNKGTTVTITIFKEREEDE